MDTLEIIKCSKIIDIVKVVLDDILLELYFNVEYMHEKLSFKLGITDDGETVYFSKYENWIELSDISYEAYSAIKVSTSNSELYKLLQNEIINIKFGVGKPLYTNKNVIYYVKVSTKINDFLFFNNGDKGAYLFDDFEAFFVNDIYGFEWSDKCPS